MRFNVKIVHAIVATALPVACTSTETPPAKPTVEGKTSPEGKPDVKPDVKPDAKPDAKPDPKPIIRIEKPTDIPVELGGAIAPYEPPPKVEEKHELGAMGSAAPAEAAPAAAAPAAPAAMARPAATPPALALAHNHAPGEACKALSRDEVERALADLQAQ